MRQHIIRTLIAAAPVVAVPLLASVLAPRTARGQAVAPASGAAVMAPHRTAADTGRFAWGHQDYSRYTTAAACDRAVLSVANEVWRTRYADTMEYVPAHDTLPTAAVTVARTCGARFTPETADRRDLWSIMRLSLVLNDEARARAALDRQLAAQATRTDSARTLRTAITTAMGAHPAHVAVAREWLARLDAIGDTVRAQRYAARLPFLTYWHAAYDADSLRATADAALVLLTAMSLEGREGVDAIPPYIEQFWVANLAQDFAAQQAIIDSGLKQVGAWHRGFGAQQLQQVAALLETQKTLYGKAARPLTTPRMFNTGGRPHPALGKPALIVAVNPTCGAYCFSQYAVIRRLVRRHPDLDVTLVMGTNGFGPGSGPLDADAEAKLAAAYYLDFLKLPAALIVDESPVTRRPDGRLRRGPSPIAQMFAAWQWANAVFVDKAGKIRWLGALGSAADARMVEAAINRAESDAGRKAGG